MNWKIQHFQPRRDKMKKWLFFTILLLLAACTSASNNQPEISDSKIPQEPAVNLPNLGPAPELNNEVWLNTDSPLRLAGLRGKVIALDMWTFG
jgi:hypothetical protein